MPFVGKDVCVLFILFYLFKQLPLLNAQYIYRDHFIDDYDEGSGDFPPTPRMPVYPPPRVPVYPPRPNYPICRRIGHCRQGERYCDNTGRCWLVVLIDNIQVLRPMPPPHVPQWPRFTTKRPPRTTRRPRTTTTRRRRRTTTRRPRTTTTRTPRTTTTRTPRTTTTRAPRTTTTRTPRTGTTPIPSTTTIQPTTTSKPCKPSVTQVRGVTEVCEGETIFEENFDSFRDQIWQIEHYIPSKSPEFPFVSYQNLPTDPTVKVENGELTILPKLQEKQPGFTNDSIFTSSIDLLQGCTSSADACVKHAWAADILPPIVSGRITSKGFAFTYGTVTVRAKLPQGDWIYPEILLEPCLQKYGSLHYSSGVINIASALGNRELRSRTTDYSNKVLFGGPVMDAQCHETLIEKKKIKHGLWSDDFHKFTLLWTPDNITLSVDGKQWAHVEPSSKGLKDQFSRMCSQLPRSLLALGTKMAPFDEHFHITLGVAAGSIKKFPDRVLTENGRAKPWSNTSRKALLNFWQDLEAWYATWNQPELLVDYIKVVAL